MARAKTAVGAFAIGIAAVSSGCAPHHPPATEPAPGSGATAAGTPPHAAFRATARALVEEKSRKLKIKVYAEPPASFRMEASGPVGGIAMIATGTNGRFRIVVPSRRVHFEGSLGDDLGSALLGVPLQGCMILHGIVMAGGLERLPRELLPGPPCDPGEMCWSALAEESNVTEINDHPCDDRTPTMLRNRIQIVKPDRSPASLPLEVRVLVRGETAPRVVLADIKPLAWPENVSEDFFWEPLPAGSRAVSAADAWVETGAEHEP